MAGTSEYMLKGDRSKVLFSIFLAAACYFFANRVQSGMHILEFPDETEKFVAARMIASGQHLYRDIFGHHGPIAYILTHIYLAISGDEFFAYGRLIPACMAVSGAMAIASSPALNSPQQRLMSTTAYLLLISTVWVMQTAGMLTYQSTAGYLSAVILAHYALPKILAEPISSASATATGAAMALLSIAAYHYIICVVGFIACGVVSSRSSRREMACLCMGMVGAVVPVILWLILFGDLKGYATYHLYFNQMVYSKYIELGLALPIKALVPNFSAPFIIHSCGVIVFCVSICLIIRSRRIKPEGKIETLTVVGLLIFAMIGLNPRGRFDFQGVGFVISAIALLSILVGRSVQSLGQTAVAILFTLLVAVSFEVASRNAVTAYRNYQWGKIPQSLFGPKADDPIAKEIRRLTSESDHLEVFVFTPKIFLNANRFPATGQISYLPWQALYNANPICGHGFDILHAIKKKRPKVIFFDDRLIWGKYLMSQYEPGIMEILKTMYSRHPSIPELFLLKE